MSTNPYSAPSSSVDTPTDPGAFELHAPRTVAAGRGVSWISEGVNLFGKAPGAWFLITIAYIVISLVPSAVSLASATIGMLMSVVFAFFTFVWAGGLMVGCRSLDAGDGLSVSHLFAGFQTRFGGLVLLSVVLFVLMIVLIVILGITMAGQFAALGLTDPEQFDPSTLASNLSVVLLPLLVLLLIMIPIVMLIWFAPALMVLNNVPFSEALGLSFKACLKNFIPFLIYGIVYFLIGIVAVVIIVAAAAAIGFAAVALYLVFAFVIFPVVQGSIYSSYKDIFIDV